MQQVYARKVFLTVLLFSNLATNADSAELDVIMSSSMPPYSSSKYSKGIAVDIIKYCLNAEDHTPIFEFVPNHEVHQKLENLQMDVAFPKLGSKGEFFTSDPILEFHNTVISLRFKNLNIEKISDLQNLNIAGFKNARMSLGKDFKEFIDSDGPKEYQEFVNQNDQISTLFSFDTDVIILDQDIFTYHFMRQDDFLEKFNYSVHPIFPPSPRYAGFKDEKIRDNFNLCLKSIKDSGYYDEIYKSYILY